MRDSTKKWLGWSAVGLGSVLIARELLRRSRQIELAGKVVLITGGSRGLGLVLARELASEGMRIAICARDADELERARRHLGASGAQVMAGVCDVSDSSQIWSFVQGVIERFGVIDLLINNAGVIEVGPFEVMTAEDFERAMKTHFWGPLNAMLAVIPHMKARGFGRIANISSLGGRVSVPHMMPYCASKFALSGLSEGMRAELIKDGIHVTTVLPGLMRTGSHVNASFKGQHRIEYALFSISDSIPVFSISAERAASRIASAIRHGDAECVVGLPAKLFVWLHGVCPGLVADIGGLLNRLLPGPGGIGPHAMSGKESGSFISPSLLTTLADSASRRNNELAPFLPTGNGSPIH